WTDSRKRRILESRRQGTRALVEGMVAAQDRPRVFVSSSAVGYYGDRGDEVLTEASGPGTGFLSEVAGVWEAEALRASAAGIRTVVVRTGLVLGPDGGMLAKLRLPFSLGLGTVLASGRHWMPWIHRDDLIRLLLHVCRADVTGPFNAASPGIVRNREFTHALAGSLGRPAFLTVPGFALRLMLGEMATLLLGSTRAVPAQAAKCGFEFRHVDIHETFLDLLR
ncbi:MAG: TIGR01777 family oxidoreductase, partial [Candidatus Eisenbacteria bacterium]|nr:TIGR01777 family oxidoreductase [Candidatus Eisenbacteria bacterium]